MNKFDKFKPTIIFIVISLIAMVYFAGIITPYGSSHGFMGDGNIPPKQFVPSYILMTLPAYIAYIVYSCFNFKKIKLRFFTYPLICFNFYIGLLYCLMAMGGVIIWLLVFTAIPLLIAMLIALIIGIIFDIKEMKNNKQIN